MLRYLPRFRGLFKSARFQTSPAPFRQISGSSSSEAFAFVFTCTKCDTRDAKRIGKRAYQQGVVIVKCDGCGGMHLVADNLGWFGEGKQNVETFMQEQGRTVWKGEVLEARDLVTTEAPSSELIDIPTLIPFK